MTYASSDEQYIACNGGVYCRDLTKLKQSINYLLAKSIIAFKFKHRLIEARLTSLLERLIWMLSQDITGS